jgi:hypothetical protein
MSRMLKILAAVIAVVAVLTLAVSGTIYAFGAGHCGSGDSSCSQAHRATCDGSGSRCESPQCCDGESLCNTDSRS